MVLYMTGQAFPSVVDQNVQCQSVPLRGVGQTVVCGVGAKSSLATSIDMWPRSSAGKEPADCETSFSKLAQSPQSRFTTAVKEGAEESL